MATGSPNHNTTFSIAKAIGILAVVVSHAATGTALETFTYYFNTAIFFFVAGYFFNDRQTTRPGQFLRRKLWRLYVPFAVIGSIFVLLHNLFLEWHLIANDFTAGGRIHPYDMPELLRMLGKVFLFLHHEQMLAPFWFLRGLFLGLMLFFGITWVSQKAATTQARAEKLRGGIVLALFTGAMILAGHRSNLPGERILITTFGITGIMYIGKLFRIYQDRIRLHPGIALICLVALAAAAKSGYRINIGAPLYGNPLLLLPLICAGCYMVLTLARRLSTGHTALTRLMDYAGRHTMAIMLWHVPLFKLVNLLQVWIYDYPIRCLARHPVIPQHTTWWWIVYTAVGITVPLLFCLLYDRLRDRKYPTGSVRS